MVLFSLLSEQNHFLLKMFWFSFIFMRFMQVNHINTYFFSICLWVYLYTQKMINNYGTYRAPNTQKISEVMGVARGGKGENDEQRFRNEFNWKFVARFNQICLTLSDFSSVCIITITHQHLKHIRAYNIKMGEHFPTSICREYSEYFVMKSLHTLRLSRWEPAKWLFRHVHIAVIMVVNFNAAFDDAIHIY